MTTYLVCVGRHMAEERPAELDPHVDMPLNQYFSYHSLDGKIIFVDQRYLNSLHAKFFRWNANIYLHFVSFLHIDTTQVVEILPQTRQETNYST